MSREILLLVDALAREKNVAKDIVFAALESALASATKKRIHDDADVVVSIDRDTGDHTSCRRWIVMPDEVSIQAPPNLNGERLVQRRDRSSEHRPQSVVGSLGGG